MYNIRAAKGCLTDWTRLESSWTSREHERERKWSVIYFEPARPFFSNGPSFNSIHFHPLFQALIPLIFLSLSLFVRLPGPPLNMHLVKLCSLPNWNFIRRYSLHIFFRFPKVKCNTRIKIPFECQESTFSSGFHKRPVLNGENIGFNASFWPIASQIPTLFQHCLATSWELNICT